MFSEEIAVFEKKLDFDSKCAKKMLYLCIVNREVNCRLVMKRFLLS